MADEDDRWQAFADGDLDDRFDDTALAVPEGWVRRSPAQHLAAFFLRSGARTVGRCSPSEYRWGVGSWLVACLAFGIAWRAVPLEFVVGWFVLTLVPVVSGSVRRLHDTDRSGAWMLLWFVPIGQWFLVTWLLISGDLRDNRFGPPPVRVNGPNGIKLHPA